MHAGGRLRLSGFAGPGSAPLAAGLSLLAVVSILATVKVGMAGLVLPLAVLAGIVLLDRPLLAVGLVVGLAIVCEGPTFGLLTFTAHLYTLGFKYVTLLDALVGVAIVSVGREVLRSGRRLWIPRALRLPLVLLALAMVSGIVVGHSGGASWKFLLASEHGLFYLLLFPVAIANLEVEDAALLRLLGAVAALAGVKALLGLVAVAGHLGQPVEGTTLSYYEPAPNWLMISVLLSVFAAALARVRQPRWLTLSSVAMTACVILSYRRSFWIGLGLAAVLVLMLGTSTAGRRLLLQAITAIALAIVLLGSVSFQSQLPLAKRLSSLSPSKLEVNREDRYRLDERANVLAAIREHPVTGLGMTIEWQATARPLPVEHEEGRGYVHFALLWFWLKLGIVGLVAYAAVLLGGIALAWRAWRRAEESMLRAFGLASMAALCGLVAIETTATFTGVDPRFTLLLATQLGVLGLIAGRDRLTEARGPLRG